ncbi:MAG: inositol monophosphatase family protein [Nitrospinota bacterium]
MSNATEEKFDIDLIEQIAVKAALAAGAIMNNRLETKFNIEHKGIIDLVTEVDIECEKTIIEIIKDTFPEHAILAEESGLSVDSQSRWIIDPLDGTTNYIHKFPFYATSIAFEYNGQIKVGVVYDPTRSELFTAKQNCGAKLNGEKIRVSKTDSLINSLLATGFPYNIKDAENNNLAQFERLAKSTQAIRRPGAASLDLCYVAAGRLDGFWEFYLQPWDIAAGSLIIEEASGTLSLLDGGKLDIYKKNIVASNSIIHSELLEKLESS